MVPSAGVLLDYYWAAAAEPSGIGCEICGAAAAAAAGDVGASASGATARCLAFMSAISSCASDSRCNSNTSTVSLQIEQRADRIPGETGALHGVLPRNAVHVHGTRTTAVGGARNGSTALRRAEGYSRPQGYRAWVLSPKATN